jgi:error-prone DNA polymerase
MGWDNPPVPWREFERRLSWGTTRAQGTSAGEEEPGRTDETQARQPHPVAYLPTGHGRDQRRPRKEDGSTDEAGSTDEQGLSDEHGWSGQRGSPGKPRRRPQLAWAELHCHSSYSFLDGASSPAELVSEAAERGLTALAITDHDGMYGVPQFAQAAARLRDSGGTLGTVFGAELSLDLGAAPGPGPRPARLPRAGSRGTPRAGTPRNGTLRAGTPRAGARDPAGRHLLILARDPEGYARLCRVISEAQLAGGEKGRPIYDEAALADAHDGHWVVLTGCRKGSVPAALAADLHALAVADPALAATAFPLGEGAADHRPASDLYSGDPGDLHLGGLHPGHLQPDYLHPSHPPAAYPLAGDRPWGGPPAIDRAARYQTAQRELRALIDVFGAENVKVELTIGHQPADDEWNDALHELAAAAGVDTVATSNVHYAGPQNARLAQTLAAIRARSSLAEMDGWLAASGGGYLRSGEEAASRLSRYPGVVERTLELAADCGFDFQVVAPKLPDFVVEGDHTEETWLRHLVQEKAPGRYGPPEAERVEGAYAQIARELDVIVELKFPGYFLIVYDIVRFCEERGILCQGRGSAANSAVCYALGITSVDPVRHGLLFERFLSAGRDGPPDIDLDIEHRRREEVIQYVYDFYGRERAAQVANVISYRPRMALRDAGRALGYSPPELDGWARQVGPRAYAPGQPVPPDAGIPEPVIELAGQMQRLPRHLGIHSGGMVICDRPVGEVCPVEWARMPGRTVLQWDKDDCAYAGLVKFDLLGLGMLTALRDCFELVEAAHGVRWDLHTIPQEDPGVYEMLQAADTVGVFQVESRAQMATLPRLRPEKFYDLVIEVALIRPGPIQGGSVHPYMRRRHGDEVPELPHESMRQALDKTLGVPLFQEQMMQIAMDCAGFSATEADRLRQAMSSKRAPERIEELHDRLVDGMTSRDIPLEVAEDIYVKILAFSSYGFPESHAISFAYLVYASAWLKCSYPAAFTAALLRAQPMGFYAPASLIGDVRRHGVQVRGVDVNASGVLAILENPGPDDPGQSVPSRHPEPGQPVPGQPVPGQPVIRLGLSEVRNLGSAAAATIEAGQPYADLEDFARRTALPAAALEALAMAGAFGCFGLSRREALWAAGAVATIRPGQLPGTTLGMTAPPLPPMTAAEETFADLWATGTYGTHPIEHIRELLAAEDVLPAQALATAAGGAMVAVGGLVTHRQQPGTAGGVVFLSLEDETGMANIICPPTVWQRYRKIGADASALLIHGRVERLDGAVSLLASRLQKLRVVAAARSRDFH